MAKEISHFIYDPAKIQNLTTSHHLHRHLPGVRQCHRLLPHLRNSLPTDVSAVHLTPNNPIPTEERITLLELKSHPVSLLKTL